MMETIKERVAQLLSEKKIAGFVGLIEKNGHVAPHLFRDPDDLTGFSLGDREKAGDARYPLNRVLVTLARAYPDEVFGVLVRGCDERGLFGLFRLNQLEEDKVTAVGLGCPPDLAKACECRKPFPEVLVAGGETSAIEPAKLDEMEGMDLDKRFDFWTAQFGKCIKCYGCRDVCPMCFCKECSLECEDLVSKGDLPVDIPVFHLTRAMHMADRCVDCGLCDEACPSDIPLRLLYKKTARIMNAEFGFTSGLKKGEKSPLSIMGPDN
ncbi:4Fe-4S ferredoxin [Desulfospira joergensenii]|uniref:4Fe-4S ferredoxin n=1 Tax=Desulfospira joergensenii TaxID=53329 RepID=UPI0003B5A72D|nr:4Fe-4S ferredoxin [Desulfospira joergensenii]